MTLSDDAGAAESFSAPPPGAPMIPPLSPALPSTPPPIPADWQPLPDDARRAAQLRASMRRGLPLATLMLIASNAFVFALPYVWGLAPGSELWWPGDAVRAYWAPMGASLSDARDLDEPWRLFTANYLHFGLFHVISNMIALLSLGSMLERVLGWNRFLFLYIGAGVGATLASTYHSSGVAAGASGAVFGVGWAWVAWCVRQRRVLPTRAVVAMALPLAFLLSVLMACVGYFVPDGVAVDNSGHIGGSLAGFILMIVMPLRSLDRPRASSPRRFASAFIALALWGVVLASAAYPIAVAHDLRFGAAVARVIPALPDELARRFPNFAVTAPKHWFVQESDDGVICWRSRGRLAMSMHRLQARSPECELLLGKYEAYRDELRTLVPDGAVELVYSHDLRDDGAGGVIFAFGLYRSPLPQPDDEVHILRVVPLPRSIAPGPLLFVGYARNDDTEISELIDIVTSIGR